MPRVHLGHDAVTLDIVHLVVEYKLPDDPFLTDQVGVHGLGVVPRRLDLVHPPIIEAQNAALQSYSEKESRVHQ